MTSRIGYTRHHGGGLRDVGPNRSVSVIILHYIVTSPKGLAELCRNTNQINNTNALLGFTQNTHKNTIYTKVSVVSINMKCPWYQLTWSVHGINHHEVYMVSINMKCTWYQSTCSVHGINQHAVSVVPINMKCLWHQPTWNMGWYQPKWSVHGINQLEVYMVSQHDVYMVWWILDTSW